MALQKETLNYVDYDDLDSKLLQDIDVKEDWGALVREERLQYIQKAIDVIDWDFEYIGSKRIAYQQSAFPRDFTECILDSSNSNDPLVLYNKKIPPELKIAVFLIVKEFLETEEFKQLLSLKKVVDATSVSVSNIAIDMDKGGRVYRRAKKVLAPYLAVNYSFRNEGSF